MKINKNRFKSPGIPLTNIVGDILIQELKKQGIVKDPTVVKEWNPLKGFPEYVNNTDQIWIANRHGDITLPSDSNVTSFNEGDFLFYIGGVWSKVEGGGGGSAEPTEVIDVLDNYTFNKNFTWHNCTSGNSDFTITIDIDDMDAGTVYTFRKVDDGLGTFTFNISHVDDHFYTLEVQDEIIELQKIGTEVIITFK